MGGRFEPLVKNPLVENFKIQTRFSRRVLLLPLMKSFVLLYLRVLQALLFLATMRPFIGETMLMQSG